MTRRDDASSKMRRRRIEFRPGQAYASGAKSAVSCFERGRFCGSFERLAQNVGMTESLWEQIKVFFRPEAPKLLLDAG